MTLNLPSALVRAGSGNASSRKKTEDVLVREILEIECSGIVLSAPPELLKTFVPANILRVEPVPLSDRVFIDTTSALAPEERMLIGSTDSYLFQICSEN